MSAGNNSEMILAYLTFDKEDEAQLLARQLVENRLAACCNLIPGMQSIYRWQEKIEQASEFILLAKTSRERFTALKSYVAKNHSYQCPCILAIPVVDIYEPYLVWLQAGIYQEPKTT